MGMESMKIVPFDQFCNPTLDKLNNVLTTGHYWQARGPPLESGTPSISILEIITFELLDLLKNTKLIFVMPGASLY